MPQELIYDGFFQRGAESFRVAIFVPERRSERSWKCGYLIDRNATGGVEYAVGSDSLQALALAVRLVRRLLIPLNVVEMSGKAPPELVFPDFLPVGYGFEFHRYISALVELEVAKKEVELGVARERAQQHRSGKPT